MPTPNFIYYILDKLVSRAEQGFRRVLEKHVSKYVTVSLPCVKIVLWNEASRLSFVFLTMLSYVYLNSRVQLIIVVIWGEY